MEHQNEVNIVDYKKIGLRIRAQRKEKGLFQEQLAEQAGISLSFIGHIERSTRIASLETVARISQALEMDMHYIVFGCSSGYNANSELLIDLRKLRRRHWTHKRAGLYRLFLNIV